MNEVLLCFVGRVLTVLVSKLLWEARATGYLAVPVKVNESERVVTMSGRQRGRVCKRGEKK